MIKKLSPQSVIDFWKSAGPERWFAKDDAFDALFKTNFAEAHWAAARRELDDWMQTPEGALALMILLDQYPRNSFRGSAHQFATDALALSFAKEAVTKGYQHQIDGKLRNFLLLPFEHSEALQDQDRYLELVSGDSELEEWGRIHRDIIVQFGRFPHRNRVLGRTTSSAEQAFLNAGG
ncbi:hypothetical protein LTR94_028429, partial [Friedmanniomyces endolithicus]